MKISSLIRFLALTIYNFRTCTAQECGGTPIEDLATKQIILRSTPRTIVEYRSTETKLYITMTSEAEAYLGIGYAKNGMAAMVGNDAVIGTKLSSSLPKGPVLRYALQSQLPEGVVQLDSTRQNLQNATFVSPIDLPSGAVGSKMTFTALLSDDHETIAASGESKFIWALGYDYNLLGHLGFGSVNLLLEPCKPASGDDDVISEDQSAKRYRNFIKVHGIMAGIAFGLFMPAAIAASALRKYLDFEVGGKKVWMQLHFALNTISFALVTVVLATAITAKNAISAEHVKRNHEKIGITVYILMCLQMIAGFARPKPTAKVFDPPSPEEQKHDHTNADQGGTFRYVDENVDHHDNKNATNETVKRITVRTVWEVCHKIMGMILLCLVCYMLKSGIDLFESIFGTQQGIIELYLVFVVLSTLLALFVLFRTIVSVVLGNH